MMSEFKNRTLLDVELPRSTQSFEKMLDDIPQTPDNVTKTRTSRTLSTTCSDFFHLTGNNNIEETQMADNEAGDKISDGNSFSDDSICTACTQCKLAKKLIGTSGIESEKKASSDSECDGLSLFVDQINCEAEVKGRENYPKRSFSDTLTSRCVVPEYFCKRFKSEGFRSVIQRRYNSGDEDPSDPAELCEDNHINVRKEFLKASADPDEHRSEESARRGSGDNVVDQVTSSSYTPEDCDSTSTQSNIEEVHLADETKYEDDSKNAAETLDHEIFSPNPTVSTLSQSTIEEVYRIEEDDHETDDFEIRSRSVSDLTISQSTVEEIYYMDATDDIDRPNSIKIAERPPQDSEGKERRLPRGEILGETAIDVDAKLQIDAGLDNVERQRVETNTDNLGCMKSLESGTEDNNQPVLENLETEAELAKESLNLATEIGNRGSDIGSLKNEPTSRFRDESFLEVSLDSEKTYIEMNLRDKREERSTRAPIDLTTINKKRVPIQDTGNSKELDRRNEKATEVTNPVHPFQDPLENFTPIPEPRKSSEDVDDTCLDLLSESELERIEKEAYTNSKRTRVAVNLGEEDRFYRPQGLIEDTEKNDDLVLPSWVTNPAPEPNYEMMRRRKRSQKEYINKILQEVLRLSEIISKVAKAVREERRAKDPDTAAKHVPRIQDPLPVQSAENYPTYNSRASTSTENRDLFGVSNISHSVEPVAGNRSDIFYAPQSLGRPKRDEASNLSNYVAIHRPVKLEASVNTVDRIGANCSEKSYVPRSGGSKYDASFIFGGQKDQLNIGRAFCSLNNAEASSFYNPSINSEASKRDWNGNKTEYSGNLETRTSRESQFPKESFKASFVSDTRYKTGNGNIDGMNSRKTVAKDAVFYSSDNSSSASRKYTKLPSVENGQIFFSKSLVSERFGPDSIQAGPTSLNFGYKLTARTNESVFYNGNK